MKNNVVLISFSVIMLLLTNCNLASPAPVTTADPGLVPPSQKTESSSSSPLPPTEFSTSTPMQQPNHILSPDNANSIVEIVRWSGHTDRVTSIAFSPDDMLLASASLDKTVKLWDVAAGQVLRTLSGHTGGVKKVVFSPDSKILVSVSGDNSIKLWDVASGQELRTLRANHPDDINSYGVLDIAFSADGRIMASLAETVSSSTNNFFFYVDLWDVASGAQFRTWSDDWIYGLAFSPDGKMLALGIGKNVILSDVSSGLEIRTFNGHTDFVHNIVFSQDGKTLISGSKDATVKIWEVASGQEIRSLDNSEGWGVLSMALSLNGKLLASAYDDGTVRLWDVAGGREIRALRGNGYTDPVWSVAFSPDANIFASAWGDGSIRLWGVQP